MRILFVTSVYTPSVSGIAVSMQNFKQELERRGHEVYILAPFHPGFRDTDAYVKRYVSIRNPFFKGLPIPFPLPTLSLIRFLLGTRFDVVHSQHPMYIGTFARLIARLNRAPLVFTYHTRYDAPFLQVLDNNVGRELIPRIVDRFCQQADLVVAPSPYVKSYLDAKKKNISVAVVPSPVSAFGDAEQTDPYAFITERPVVVCLAVQRLTYEKKTHFAIEAFAHLPAAYHLVVVGNGPEQKRLEQLALDSGVAGRVHFVGAKSRQALGAFYRRADAFVFTSTTETQSMGVLEAALWGLPIVIADSLFSRSVVPSDSCIRAPLNPELFAKAVFLAHKNREKLGARAAAWARTFSSERCGALLEQEYEKCVAIKKLAATGWQSWSTKQTSMTKFSNCLYNPLGKDNYAVPAGRFAEAQRRGHKAITGWISWGAYGTAIDEEKVRAHVAWMREHRARVPLEYVLIDDGWTRWGDWQMPSGKKFPHGLKRLVRDIHAQGLRAGIWMAPFLASPRSFVVRQFPSWFVRDGLGFPVDGAQLALAGDFPAPKAPARRLLDVANPAVWEYLERSVDFLVRSCGFDCLKLDFLFAPYFTPEITVQEASGAVGRLLSYVKRKYPGVYVIGCGAPLVDAVGLVDAMRVGRDSVFPFLRRRGIVSAVLHAHRFRTIERGVRARLWTSAYWALDPDALVCGSEFSLRAADIGRMARLIRDARGCRFLSDDLTGLSESEVERFIVPLFEQGA